MNHSLLKSLKSLMIIFFALLLIFNGCGSSGGGGPSPEPSPEPDTNTGTAIDPGTYHIYEERMPPCAYVAVGFFDYDIIIEQTPGSDQAYIYLDNQFIVCNADNADKTLDCTGRFIFEDGLTYNYSLYSLMQQSVGDLIGEAEYEAVYSSHSYDCRSESTLTTRLPEYGSFIIQNDMDYYTVRYLELLSCYTEIPVSNYFEDNQFISPGAGYYLRDREPGCYNVIVFDDQVITSDSIGYIWRDQLIERGRTTILGLIEEEAGLIRIQ